MRHKGLQSYAIKHYEVVLKLAAADRLAAQTARMDLDTGNDVDNDDKEPDDYGKLAAYNLTSLYVTTGSPELARVIAKRWLAV